MDQVIPIAIDHQPHEKREVKKESEEEVKGSESETVQKEEEGEPVQKESEEETSKKTGVKEDGKESVKNGSPQRLRKLPLKIEFNLRGKGHGYTWKR